MKSFLLNEKKQFCTFIQESKILIGIITFIILFTYGIKIFNLDFSIDTDAILNNYDMQMYIYETQGRVGLVFTKFLFFIGYFNPYVANFLTYFTFGCVSLLLCYLVQRILGSYSPEKQSTFIIPILFITNPILAEQFNFILQSFEVSLAILFLVLALLFTFYFIQTGYKTFAIISMILCAWSILTYQSLLLFFISGAIASLLLILHVDVKDNNIKSFKEYLFISLKYLLIFLLSFVISQIVLKIYYKLSGLQLSSYITGQISWGKAPVSEIVERIQTDITNFIYANNIFYNYSFIISMILVALILIWKLIKKNKAAYLEFAAFILLFVSPFLLTIFLGHGEAIRAQMPAIQLVIAFNFYYIYLNLKKTFPKFILFAICIYFGIYQSNLTANFLFSEHMKFMEDVQVANRINGQLDQMGIGSRNGFSLVLLGQHHPESSVNMKGETLGQSFFAWDIGTKQGTTYRAIGFMRILGYKFNDPTEEQLDYAHSIKNEMTTWPAKESIKIVDNLIIIKLSE
jgi:hypothetical protein